MTTSQKPLLLNRAIDLYIAHLDNKGRTARTLATYERLLFDFARVVDPHGDVLVEQIIEPDCLRFLNRWRGKEPSTRASGVSLLRGFFKYLDGKGYLVANPAADLERPPRKRPEFVKVVSVSGQDVVRLIEACETIQELICLGVAAYMGRRRAALANARRSDADLDAGFLTFVDKGGKTISQPIPDELLTLLREADQMDVWETPNDYLIPNRRRSTTNQKQRSSKIVYETVTKVGERAGVRVHVHALRAAFAVQFLTNNPGRIEAAKELLAHDRIETTMVYLRRMNRAAQMEDVRGLSWSPQAVQGESSGFEPRPVEAHTGFEPVSASSAAADSDRNQSVQSSSVDPMRAKLDGLRLRSRDLRQKGKKAGAAR